MNYTPFKALSLPVLFFFIVTQCSGVAIQLKDMEGQIFKRQMILKINSEPIPTNTSGYANFDLKTSYDHFKIDLINDTFKIIYPFGDVYLLKDNNAVIDITIGKVKDFKIYTTIALRLEEVSRKINKQPDQCKYLKETFDSLVKITFDPVDLRIRRDSVFPIITPLFNRYSLNLLNLAYAFERFSETTFKDSAVKRNLNAKMVAYNFTFDSLYIMKDNIKKWINDYWRNDNLQNDLNQVLADCFEKHSVKVLTIRNQIRAIDDMSRTKRLEKKNKNEIEKAIWNLQHTITDDLKASAALLAEKINKLNIQLIN